MAIKRMNQTSLKSSGVHRKLMAGSTLFADMELIATVTVGATAVPTITFTVDANWLQFKHLQLRVNSRSNAAGDSQDLYLRFNNDSTASNYAYHALYGTGSVAGSEAAFSHTGARVAQSPGSTFTSGVFFPAVIDILDFANTSKNVVTRTLSGNTGTYVRTWLGSNLWIRTTAITSINIVTAGGASFIQGSSFSVYGIRG